MNSETHAMAFWLRGASVAACSVVCMCLASCGGSPGQGTACTTLNSTTGSVRAGDDQNGKSITLHPGQTLFVTLCSTWWSLQGSSNSQVLAPVGAAVASPAPFDKNTCPYGGCGTASEEFRAVGLGAAQVTASRVSCSEAMRCTGAAGQYQLTVKVTVASQ
jgi:hypothetical protein